MMFSVHGGTGEKDRKFVCYQDGGNYYWEQTAPDWREEAATTIKEGLVGHWTFNEGSGTTAYDYSGNNNHGTLNVTLPKSCKHILDRTPSATSGVYSIDPDGDGVSFGVYCDMTTDGGGWTMVYQNLFSGNEGGPTPTQTSSTYGTVAYQSDYGVNAQSIYSQIGATEMMLKDGSNWIKYNLTSAEFNAIWNIGGDNTYTITSINGNPYTRSNSYHSHDAGVNQFGTSVNAGTIFEYNYMTSGRDTNHYWHIWPAGDGTYAISDGVTGDRWGAILIRESTTYNDSISPIYTISNTTTPGQALDFDGVDDVVSLPTSLDLSGWTSGTIELWTYFEDGGGGTLTERMFFQSRASGYKVWFYVNGSDIPVLDIGPGTVITGNSTLPVNTWTHVAVTFDENGASIYLNGVLDKSDLQNYTIPTYITAYNVIGRYPTSNAYAYNGKIDDVRIYNRALRPEEVRYLYETTYRD
jgi:hypothetical protein